MSNTTLKYNLISHSYLLARSVYKHTQIQRFTLSSFAILLEIFLPVSALTNAIILSETTGQMLILLCATPPIFYLGYRCNLLVQSLVLHVVYRYPKVDRMIRELAKDGGLSTTNALWYREALRAIRKVRHKSFWL